MIIRNRLIALALFILNCSCSLTQDFNIETNERIVVVNGYLHPDSIIKVSITYSTTFPSLPIVFSPINTAKVQLFENGEILGYLHYISDGVYHLPIYPKVGFEYNIVVQIDGEKTLFARTSIPENIIAEACYNKFDFNNILFNNKIFAQIELNNSLEKEYYWLNVVSEIFPRSQGSYDHDSSRTEKHLLGSPYSVSPYLDDFNTLSDAGRTQYRYYLRVEDNFGPELKNYSIDIYSFETNYFFTYSTIQSLASELGLYVNIFNTSKEMDAYWKSSILSFINSNSWDGGFNPFAEQIPIYTNIENGAGIFAGYNSRVIPLHLLPCQ